MVQGGFALADDRRPPVDEAGVAPRTSADGRSQAGPRHTDCSGRLAGHGPGPGDVLAAVSSRLDPRRLVERGRIASAPAPAAASPGPRRSMGHGWGGHPGAPPWRDEPGSREGSRSGALLPQPEGPRARVARGEPHALGPQALGPAGLGRPVLDGAGPGGALPSGPWPTTHAADRWGPAQAPGGAALGARAPPGAGPRAPCRRDHGALAAASVGPAPMERNARAAGCRTVRPRPAPAAQADGAAALARPAPADLGPGLGQPGPLRAHRDRAGLVG
jgi:hypothetical protein